MSLRRLPAAGLLPFWVAAAVCGAAVALAPKLLLALIVLAALAALWWLVERFGFGMAIGVLVLVCLDVLPGPDLETLHVFKTVNAQACAVGVLIGVLAWWNFRDGFRALRRARFGGFFAVWSIVFLSMFVANVFRTTLSTPIPLYNAAWIEVYLPFFALLLPLMIGPMTDPEVRRRTLGVLAIGAFYFSLIFIANCVHVSMPALLIHSPSEAFDYSTPGFIRTYAAGFDLPTLLVPAGAGLALFGTTRRTRGAGLCALLVGGIAIIVSLTRAEYVAMILGLGAGLFIFVLLGSEGGTAEARRRLLLGFGGAIVVIVLIVAVQPPSVLNTAVSGVSARISSTFEAFGQSQNANDNSLGLRELDRRQLESLLGDRWFAGVGFLDAHYDYQSLAPGGQVENSDLGVYNILMTMGVLGVFVYYIPVVGIAGALTLAAFRRRGSPVSWIGFGIVVWLVSTIVASYDLVGMYTTTGVVTVALVCALGVSTLEPRPSQLRGGRRPWQTDSPR